MFKVEQSIEHAHPINVSDQNPFETEVKLYTKEYTPGDITVTVIVPDFYHIALPNIGHQMVEHQINQIPGFFADRAYLSQEYKLLKEYPSLKPDIVFISMSYEGSYIRALRALDEMGISFKREERKDGDPLIVVGGWSVSRNPLPLFEIADIIGIGDSEHLVESIINAYKNRIGGKKEMYEYIKETTGIIIPSLYDVETQDGYLIDWEPRGAPFEIYPSKSEQFPHSWYLSSETDYNVIGYYDGKTFFSMEIVDACASKCAFCASGFREKNRDIQDLQTVVELAEWGRYHGADLTKLFFPANSSVHATKEIMRELIARGFSPRVGSAKAERIDREYIELVGKSGQEKIAFAPETGDYELRRALGKPGMTNAVLDNVLVTSIQSGIPNLDFYFIMNLPGEKEDSLQKTIDLLGHFHALAKSSGLKGRIRMSMPNFFPKAGTPFQYAASGSMEIYSERIVQLEEGVRGLVTVSSMKDNVDLLSQNIMSRGGVEVGGLLIEVYRKIREREEREGVYSSDTIEDWREALSALGLKEATYFEQKSSDKPLPWDHIHTTGIPNATLVKAWEVFNQRRSKSQ
jgi:radical SAM superfamily enzyme YgiQ (UPF0313 family)